LVAGFAKADVESGQYAHIIPGSDDPELVTAWRRSWFAKPPPLADDDPRRIEELRLWGKQMPAHLIPRGESLEMVAKNRVRPFLDQVITPALNEIAAQKKKQLNQAQVTTGLVVAHANSLRALLGIICEVEDDPEALAVLERLKIPTGVPLVVCFQKRKNGKYRAFPLPEPDTCIIESDNGLLMHPPFPPPDLGHPKLPVWPLDSCIPLEQLLREQETLCEEDPELVYRTDLLFPPAL
jgi:hypothetical protein